MNQVDTTKLRVPTEALGSYTVGLHYYIDSLELPPVESKIYYNYTDIKI